MLDNTSQMICLKLNNLSSTSIFINFGAQEYSSGLVTVNSRLWQDDCLPTYADSLLT
jgi:hypothetical protein